MVEGELVSQPYVAMTLAVMEAFGVRGRRARLAAVRRSQAAGYRGREYAIEPDASAASYFFAAAAITGGEVTVEGLGTRQPARRRGLRRCAWSGWAASVRQAADGITVTGGPLTGIDVDMNAISDTVQTLAVGRPVRRRADDDPQRRPHPPQGDRPHRGPGDGAAQARGGRRGVRRRPADRSRGR